SKERVEAIRNHLDKERRKTLKANLPTVFFAGKFKGTHNDDLLEHSNLVILDFDEVTEAPDLDSCEVAKSELCKKQFIYACWISPSGNGLKALVKIADGEKHQDHFAALQEEFKNLDKSGTNVARHCFESYDENIYINEGSKVFRKIKTTEKALEPIKVDDSSKIFENILRWLSNKGDAFVKGERNYFVFKLASACCRFGISEDEC